MPETIADVRLAAQQAARVVGGVHPRGMLAWDLIEMLEDAGFFDLADYVRSCVSDYWFAHCGPPAAGGGPA